VVSSPQERPELLKQAADFKELATGVEAAILKKMWFNGMGPKGMFLALTPEGPLTKVSVSNLFGLGLPNISEGQLEATLDQLNECFITPEIELPIPGVPPIDPITGTANRDYDPEHGEWDRLWRGPTWINMNWYLVERGLDMQAKRADLSHRPDLIARCQKLTVFISERSYKVVEGVGLFEFYGPESTRPLREKRSPGFTWSALAYLLKDEFLTIDDTEL
jgi:hypothetical protein